jgi:hypothetical protein
MMTQEVTWWLGNKQSITRRYIKKIACWNLTYRIDRSEREKSRDICAALCSTAQQQQQHPSMFLSLASLFSREGENGRYITSDSSRSYPHQCPTPSTAKSGGKQEMLVLHQNIEKKKILLYKRRRKLESIRRRKTTKGFRPWYSAVLLYLHTYPHLTMHLPCIYRRTIYLYKMEERERYSLLVRLLLR